MNFALLPSAGASVSGRVNAARLPGRFWVALTPVNQPAFALGVTPTEEDGGFQFDGIPPGVYDLLAAGPTMGRGARGATLDERALFARTQVELAGAQVDGVTVAAQEGRSASLLARAASPEAEQACPGTLRVRLAPLEDWAVDLDRNVQSAQGKMLAVHDLAPERYSVRLEELGEDCRMEKEVLIDLRTQSAARAVVNVVPGS